MMGLRTADGLSESVTAEQVLSSIILFGIIYSMLFAVWVFVLNHKIQHGPESADELLEYKRTRHDGQSEESMSETFGHTGTSRGGGLMDEGVR